MLSSQIITIESLESIASTPEEQVFYLPERPSPDGGEDKTDVITTVSEEDNWTDWELQENDSSINGLIEKKLEEEHKIIEKEESCSTKQSKPLIKSNNLLNSYIRKPIITNISELDIKNSKVVKPIEEEIDYFSDMEPVIKHTQSLLADKVKFVDNDDCSNVFGVNLMVNSDVAGCEIDGWENELDDWDAENN